MSNLTVGGTPISQAQLVSLAQILAGATTVAFSPNVPFTLPEVNMGTFTMTGPLAFTGVTTGAIPWATVAAEIIGNGTDTPTFTNAQPFDADRGFNRGNGIQNFLTMVITPYGSIFYFYAQAKTPVSIYVPSQPTITAVRGGGTRRAIQWRRAALLVEREVFRFQAELGQDVLHGNALAAALREPGLAFPKAAAVVAGNWFVFVMDHDFKQLDDGGELLRSELAE